jgi:nitroreductase
MTNNIQRFFNDDIKLLTDFSKTDQRLGKQVLALDAGHVGQNLYLTCENVGAESCAIVAYDQKKADELLNIDGDDEFVIYMYPVGKR